jgi:hypothetical protein
LAKSSNKSSAEERLNLLQSKKQAAITAGNTEEARKYQKAIEAVTNAIEKQNLELEASLNNITDLSDSVKSLGAFVGKNNKLFETMNSLTDSMSTSLDSISQQMTKLGPEAGKFKKETYKTAEAYKNLGNVIAVNTKKLKKQQTTTSQYNQSVLDSYDDLEEAIDRLDGQMEGLTGTSLKAAEAIKRTLEGQKSTLESFAKAAERSEKAMKATGFAFEQASAAGIPAANELGNVVKTMQEGGKGLTLSFAALGAVLGKMAYDLGFIGDKIGTIAKYDILIGDLTTKIDIFNDKLRLGMVGSGGKNFVAARAINDFNNQLANMAMEFQAASKTALFGKSLGGVGYGAAQLQMAGISAETIASAMKDASSAMGSNVNGKFGADMAILAARTGQTSEGIASINDTFMRIGGVSKETAINMQEGLRTMADQANINLGSLMEDVAEASKDALSYQLKSPAALAKAATFAQTLGTKFTDIANAGKSMVLNYKDSIKAEMSLSAMLGKRVDLSQVRALFAAGKTEDAIKALKAQGLDPSKMNMFQQEALKNATGGMDLNTLQKIATRTGRSGGELGKGDVTGENQVFLSTKSSAESAKAVGSAVKAAMTEIQNKELENQYNKAKNKALINNTDGIADLTAQLKKLEAEKGIMTGGLAYMLGGALIGGGLGAGIGKLFKGGGTGTAATATGAGTTSSAAGSSMGGMFDKNGKPLTQSQINMKLTKGGTVPIGGTNAPMTASPSGNVSKLTKMGKGMGGKMLGIAGAGFDAYSRIKSGQSVGQTAAGVGGGMAGAYALGSAGASLGLLTGPFAAVVSPVLGLVGGMVGYFGGSSIADALTGANEPSVKAQETIQTELNESQIAQSVKDGQLLSDSAYTIELQKEMVAQLGLSTTLLYEIADYNARGLFQSVNIDGKKVMEALASTSRKQFGVARNTMSSTTVR